MMRTPLTLLTHLGSHLNVDLRVKRDDLYPSTGGGNKARKIARILEDAQDRGCDAVVTTGGLQSNHARASALAAAVLGWRCKLVLHSKPENAIIPVGNLMLVRLAGAEIEIVEPSDISQAMSQAMHVLRREGFRPYEICGGGHCLLGTLAYADAMVELHSQCQSETWQPDWIILASGTGTTQAGLMIGLEQIGWSTRIVGVSVARRNPRGRQIVEDAYLEAKSHLEIGGKAQRVDFRDDWIGKGYERADGSVLATIRMVAKKDGLILDPTYTGKAFTALVDMVREGEIAQGARVLFWHTGGLLNLMASKYPIVDEASP